MIPTNFYRNYSARHRAALALLITTLIVGAVAFSSGSVSSQDGDPQRRDLDRIFSRHERLTLDPGQIQKQVKQTRALTLNTSRGTFEMTLEPHDMRAPDYRAEATSENGVRVLERTPVRTYKGTVKGLPGAQARLTIDEGTVEGLIVTPSELFFLEPGQRFSQTAAKTDFVFYAASDVKESAGECVETMAQIVVQRSAIVSNQAIAKGPQPEAIFGPAMEIDIATDADVEYFNVFGSNTNQQILSIMSQVEGIYNTQLGLQFKIVFQHVYETANDPYTLTNVQAPTPESPTILSEFQDYWNTNRTTIQRDTVHLWTGKDIDGDTIGVAYRPGMECPFVSQSFAYGISQHLTGPGANLAGLTAHEIGHNLGAAHVTSAQGSDCFSTSPTTRSIMNSSLSSSTNFCGFSRDEITAHSIANQGCLTSLAPACSYQISPLSQSIPAGGGTGSVTVTPSAGCSWIVAEGEPWLTVTSGSSGSTSGTVNYSVAANTCGQRTGLMGIGGQIHTINQAGKDNYLTDPATATAIGPGQTINGELSSPDCATGIVDQGDDPPTIRVNALMDRYRFFGMAGQKIRIEMNSPTTPQNGGLDTYLYLYAPDGTPVAENDDLKIAAVTNSRIPCSVPCDLSPPEFLTLPQTGTYIIIATSFLSGDSGTYSLTLTSEPLLLAAQVTDSVGTAAALNSVTFARTSDPTNQAFRIFDPYNFSADQTTRLILFTSDLGQQSTTSVSVSAGGHPLVVEHVGPFTFPGLNGTQIVVALKRSDGGTMPTGSLAFTVTTATLTSNLVTITIAP